MLKVLLIVLTLSFPCRAQFGQLLMTYYTGLGADTLGPSGINALSLAFFDPTPLGTGTCDFTDLNTRCLVPATGSGSGKNLQWALNIFNQTVSALSGNTSPSPGRKPTIFFSFGGQSQGGASWDSLLGNEQTASTFGLNAAKLVSTVYQTIGQRAYVGFDLDIEGTSSQLPYIGSFVKTFRSHSPYNTFPVQLCALSGLASPSSSDHYKLAIMQQYGPRQQGINFLNMMVNNVDSSCSVMSSFWRDPALDFIPPGNKVLGVWGEILASWILHNPGCTDGSDPLFGWIKQNQVGIGIWQWWVGSTNEISSLIKQIHS
eukprot:TRINITY_DN7584_c0_g3_i1.p1 TRINITY_DN7584_c0_g3~~TRINITY_DN7584_c0_g3_i1.p1  ORF type:complete len:328 (+),score=51.68 TRINITY_DN7584_c0_g3_i1:38-985(+)